MQHNAKLIFTAEVGGKVYCFTDNLEASNPKRENLKTLRSGNQKTITVYIFLFYINSYI
jgi:hypothetical protein